MKTNRSIRAALLVFSLLAVRAQAESKEGAPDPFAHGGETGRAPVVPGIVARGADRESFDEPTGALTLAGALAAALADNPALRSFAWETRAREAELFQAGRRPNPELSGELEDFAGTGDLAGLSGAEAILELSQRFETGGKREKRRIVARWDHDLSAWDYESARMEVMTDVAKAFIRLLAAQERLAIAGELVEVAGEILSSVARRVREGAVSPVEESRARVELEMNRVERDRAETTIVVARRALAAAWGSADPRFSEASGSLEKTQPPRELDALLSRIEKNPDVARWSAEERRAGALVDFERAMRLPDFDVGAGVRRRYESDDTAFLLRVAVPLPLFDRNRGSRQAAAHRLRRIGEERRTVEIDVRTEVAAAHEELISASAEIRALGDDILPEAENAFTTARDAYRRGLMRLTDVLDTERFLFELRGRKVDALARYHTAFAEIGRLVGEPIEDLLRRGGDESS